MQMPVEMPPHSCAKRVFLGRPSLISLRAGAWSHTSYLTISFYFSRAMVNSFALDDGESHTLGALKLEPRMILSWQFSTLHRSWSHKQRKAQNKCFPSRKHA